MEYIVDLIIYMEKSGLISSLNDKTSVSYILKVLWRSSMAIHVCYLASFKFCSW